LADGVTEGEVSMRWGDPLFGRIDLYVLVGVIALLAVAYVVRAALG
jgi:hypothetical protein